MGIVGLIEPDCQSKGKRSDLSPAETEAEWIVVRKPRSLNLKQRRRD